MISGLRHAVVLGQTLDKVIYLIWDGRFVGLYLTPYNYLKPNYKNISIGALGTVSLLKKPEALQDLKFIVPLVETPALTYWSSRGNQSLTESRATCTLWPGLNGEGADNVIRYLKGASRALDRIDSGFGFLKVPELEAAKIYSGSNRNVYMNITMLADTLSNTLYNRLTQLILSLSDPGRACASMVDLTTEEPEPV